MKPLKVNNFEQGDIDPTTSLRFDTGFMALNAHKNIGSNHAPKIKTLGTAPSKTVQTITKKVDDQLWGVQIGAFNSRIATETAIKTAKRLLPPALRYSQNTISPLIAANSQHIYRARLTGYTKNDAEKVCSYFEECMVIAPPVNHKKN